MSPYNELFSPSFCKSCNVMNLLRFHFSRMIANYDYIFQCKWLLFYLTDSLKVVTNEKGEAVGEVVTIIC
jgi:hypothetical protein